MTAYVLYGGPLGVVGLSVLGWIRPGRWLTRAVWGWLSALLGVGVLTLAPHLRLTQPSSLLALVVLVITWASAGDSLWWTAEHPAVPLTRYYLWWAGFWASLTGLALTDNLAAAWLWVELSTVTSAALILEMHSRRALEAAWKYVLIVSVGLLLGLLGLILLYAGLGSHHAGFATFNFGYLETHWRHIPLGIRQLSGVLLIVGLGTKVGLAPFHTWLPDAHAEAPAPVSGLLSGVLLGLTLWTLHRYLAAVPMGPVGSGSPWLLWLGVLSVMVGSFSLFMQREVKRLLAYSSVEQVGMMAIGLGLGTSAGIAAALWQWIFHAGIKSGTFFVSGHLSERLHAKRMDAWQGAFRRAPRLGTVWAVGILALSGVPPLGISYSEWLLVRALWLDHQTGVLVLLSVGLTVTFMALLYHLLRGLFGSWERRQEEPSDHERLMEDPDGQERALGHG
ncbi:NADH dehydrogenase (quinone) [Sulfobacillus acidophilus DSM 10332]|uniref:NADH dehydrogenase (Quinone) n=1 Tax=Sulfobacillus acidophilus (strain ATCC 700253 / DSM 10332 / NAL) TaxID=679936 RepID=G8U0F7_SULAD|nr:NADH dehydrogenase (quinone) [Sulfobacillus acidophilus DSM 10332]